MSVVTEDRAGTVSRLTVSEVAAAAGVAPSAVRFYEQHGLIASRRTAGNQRRFDHHAVCVIKVAKVAQGVGLTVREIADALAHLPDEPGPADWSRLRDLLVTEAESRVSRLKEHLDRLGSQGRLCELG